MFWQVMDRHNLKGEAKLIAIQAYCRKKGLDSFAYVGDSVADIPIWTESVRRTCGPKPYSFCAGYDSRILHGRLLPIPIRMPVRRQPMVPQSSAMT